MSSSAFCAISGSGKRGVRVHCGTDPPGETTLDPWTLPRYQPTLTTTNQLASTAQTDRAFLAVAEALVGGPGFSAPKLVREMVESASVPFLPAHRYKESGLRNRHDWEPAIPRHQAHSSQRSRCRGEESRAGRRAGAAEIRQRRL